MSGMMLALGGLVSWGVGNSFAEGISKYCPNIFSSNKSSSIEWTLIEDYDSLNNSIT